VNYQQWIPTTIKTLRANNDMTLADLAGITGLSISYLSDIERARTIPTLETLDTILRAFGATLTLSIQKDYIPNECVWVNRKTIKEIADLISTIT